MVGDWGGVIDEKLAARRGEEVTAVVRLPESKPTRPSASATIETLQDDAAQAQRAVSGFANERDGVRVKSRFWITNAMVLSVDTAKTPLEEIVRIPEVDRIHENFDVEPLDDGAVSSNESGQESETLSHGDHTYGLEQVDAPSVWNQLGTKGAGARVAVLDTGIDPSHPDIDLAQWAEFDSNGNQINSDPYDSNGHGTHTSGTVSGGADSGTHIGVAPDVELYHGGVLTPEGGTFSAVVAGIQWAVEQNADVINMSLGATGYASGMIEPMQNAKAAGTFPVSSCGNSDEGSSGVPANVYDAGIAVGASDESVAIAEFSSGEKIVTDQDWGSSAPADWPAEYVVPDVSGPGVSVKSSIPGGGYGQKNGTSMAAPHVAGVACLMVSASDGDVTPQDLRDVLEATAWKPDSWDESQANAVIDGKDSRYGLGIVDALAAVKQIALDTGVTGIVESDSAAVEGATVEVGGFTTTTDQSGSFEMSLSPGTYDLRISGPGIVDTELRVTVEDSGSLTDLGTIVVDPALNLLPETTQPSKVEGGETISLTFSAHNLDSLTITTSGTYDESNATLTVNGQTATFGDPISFTDYTGSLSVTLGTTADTSGELGLEYAASGLGEQLTLSTGPTAVYPTLHEVGVIDAGGSYGSAIAETLRSELSETYRASTTTTSAASNSPSEYAALVVQLLDGNSVSDFVSTTESADVGVVYLDQWGGVSDGIAQYASVSSNVTDVGTGYGNGGPYYGTGSDHPLFAGVSTDTDITLHSGSSEDYSWFQAGDGVEVVAPLRTGNGTVGDGLAIHEQTRTVLASSLGRNSYAPDDSFTAAADTILANAVRYVDGITPSMTATALLSGSDLQLSIDATAVEWITIEDLWADWATSPMSYSRVFEDAVETDSTCEWDWSGLTGSISTGITATIPDRYVGGTYAITITAGAIGEDPVSETVTISLD